MLEVFLDGTAAAIMSLDKSPLRTDRLRMEFLPWNPTD
jgi:hypothetical protein